MLQQNYYDFKFFNIKKLYKYFLDTTKDKQNKLLPGTKIPIVKYRGEFQKNGFCFLRCMEF